LQGIPGTAFDIHRNPGQLDQTSKLGVIKRTAAEEVIVVIARVGGVIRGIQIDPGDHPVALLRGERHAVMFLAEHLGQPAAV